MSTAKEIFNRIPRSILDSAVKDIHLDQLAKEMTGWQEISPKLDITEAEEEEILEKHRGNLRLQKREALRKWREKNGSKATYRKLIVIFCAEGLAETVERLLLERGCSGSDLTAQPTNAIDIFHDYLKDCYSDLPDQPLSPLLWPGSSPHNYVALDLHDAPITGTASELKHHKPIELQALFTAGSSKAKRKVILIEGVAGAGKTTLSLYACKEWAAGNLFKDIKLLIHISLGDPVIHSARNVADIIPHPSEEMRASAAKAIVDNRDRKVCFWLDGCDEAPPSLWESFLHRFIAGLSGRTMVPNAHLILTSRPQISASLAATHTGKVIIHGLHSLQDFVTACSPVSGDRCLRL